MDESPYLRNVIEPLRLIANWTKPELVVYPTGLEDFDMAMDGGVREGELNVISGPTSHGKTSYAQYLTLNFDKRGLRTLWFTYEMSPYHLQNKFEILLGDRQTNNIMAPVKELEGSMDFVRDYIAKGVEFGCNIVFIDHLHYLIPLNGFANVSLLVGSIVRELKKIAVQMKVCIFLIAHSKKVYAEEQLDLNSIRDSSLIAQEATYVFLVERVKKEQPKKGRMDKEPVVAVGDIYEKQTRITLAKNRTTGQSLFRVYDYDKGNYTPASELDLLYEEYRGDIQKHLRS